MLSTEKSEISGQHLSAGATVQAVYLMLLSQDSPLPCRACILLKDSTHTTLLGVSVLGAHLQRQEEEGLVRKLRSGEGLLSFELS